MSRFQDLIDQLLSAVADLNHEVKAAGLDQDLPELWDQAGRATDAICLLEAALVDVGLVVGARTETEAVEGSVAGHARGPVCANRFPASRTIDEDDEWVWVSFEEEREAPPLIH